MTPSDQSDLHRGLDRLKEQLIRLDRERADTKHQIDELTQRLDRVVVVADEEPEASAPLTSKAKVRMNRYPALSMASYDPLFPNQR